MGEGLSIRNGRVELSDGDRAFRLEIERLDLTPGEVVALTGASGSGKTLVLEVLGLLRRPAAGGEYVFGALDLAGLWLQRSDELARQRGALFGFVPQVGGLMPFLTVDENIALTQQVSGREDDVFRAVLIERLGLSDVATLRPAALSIGQRQRTAIARALAHRPPFVIADEPTAALDPESADAVLSLLLETAHGQGTGVILSSHDVDRIARHDLSRLTLEVEAGSTVTSRLRRVPC